MEETININIGGYITGNEVVSISKFRLWPSLLAYSRWILKNTIPGHNLVRSGLGITVINNLAIAVEGFVADMVVEKLDTNQPEKPKEIIFLESKATWAQKRGLFNKNFKNKLESYPEFESIKVLFSLRNNFLHGLSHSEVTTRKIDSEEWAKLKSTNDKYQVARSFFVKKGLLKDAETHSNVEMLWKLEIVVFLYSETQKLLTRIMADNDLPNFIGINNEMKNAFFV